MEVLHVRNQKVADTPSHRVYRVIDHPPGWRRAVRADGGLDDRESPVRVSGRSPSASV